jgi:hypothetical protein
VIGDGRIQILEGNSSCGGDLFENAEQRRLGAPWEARSNGKGPFSMPKGMDFAAIRMKIAAESRY